MAKSRTTIRQAQLKRAGERIRVRAAIMANQERVKALNERNQALRIKLKNT